MSDYASMPTISESNGWLLKVYTMDRMVWLHSDGIRLRDWRFSAGGQGHCYESRLDGSLLWTSDKPNRPGFYWWRVKDEHRIAELVEIDGELHRVWQDFHVPVEHSAGDWAGPIAEPVGETLCCQ